MRIDSPLMTNSDATGSFTGSFVGDGSGLTGLTTASYIEFNNVDGLTSFSSSIQGRVSNLEDFSSSLDATYATDADLNLVSSSVDSLNAATSSYALEAKISGSFTSLSSSYEQRIRLNEEDIDDLLAATSSYALEAKISGSFTSLSSSIAADIEDIIDGTTTVTSASYALTASYAEGFTASSISSTALSTEYIDFDLNPTASPQEGRLVWNADDGTLDLGLDGVTLQLGQEQYWYVRNNTENPIANGAAVMASGTLGASGRITIAPMIADGTIPAKFFLGIATEEILAGEDGYVTTFGKVRGIDTSLIPSGSVMYVSPDTSGALTTIQPTAPHLKLPVAFTVSQKSNGTLAVRANTGVRLANSHDVEITNPVYGELLMRSGSIWINSSELSGSYGLTGSLAVDSITGSLLSTNGVLSGSAQIADEISGSLGANATLIRSLTATGISGSFIEASSSIAVDIRSKLNVADTGSFAKTNVNNVFSGTQTFNNLTVNGTGSFNYIESITGSAKIIGDAFIVVNSAGTGSRFAGLSVYDSGSNTTSSLQWDSLANKWQYLNSGDVGYSGGGLISGPRITGSQTVDDISYPTQNTILRGQGGDHIYDSNITDDDSNVIIGIDTQITGSLSVTGNIESYGELVSHKGPIGGSENEGGELVLRAPSGASYTKQWVVDANQNKLRFVTEDDGTGANGAEVGYIDTSGNVQFDGTLTIGGASGTINGNTILTTADEGAGNGIDADTVDSLQASSFLRSDADDTATGVLTLDGQVNLNSTVRLNPNGTNFEIDTDTNERVIFSFNVNGTRNWSLRHDADLNFYRDSGTGNVQINGNRILTTADEGSGNGLDADTLDSLDSTQFFRSDAADNAIGFFSTTDVNSTGDPGLRINNGGRLGFDQSGTRSWNIKAASGNLAFASGDGNGSLTFNSNRLLTVADEGSGNGLDADTVDSLQASQFLRSDADDTATGTITISGKDQSLIADYDVAGENWSGRIISKNDTTGVASFLGNYNGFPGVFAHNSALNAWNSIFINTLSTTGNGNANVYTGTLYVNGNIAWHAGNDGAASGLDADTVDGLQASQFLRSDATDSTSGTLTIGGGLVIEGSAASGGTDYGYYENAGTNIILKGDSNGRSGIFFQSEKDGTNINHPSDFGFLQFHSYGYGGTTGEANALVLGVANDSTDIVVLQSPYNNGVKIGYRDATSGTGLTLQTVLHTGNYTSTLDGRYYTETESDSRFVNVTGDTMTGVLTIQSSNDNQLLVQGTDTWAGIGFDDSNSGTDYIWYNGVNQTFAIGGGGSNVTGKKLHVDGGMSIGSSADSVAMPSNGLYVEGAVSIGTTSNSAKLEVYNSGSTVFAVNGSQGQLFSIEDDLTGTIFTVADISGVPILEVEDTGVVTIDDTLQVYGDITAYYSSDERLKDNITLIENANKKVMQLRGVEFDWNENSKHEGHDVGVIAQDVEKVLPELVQDRKNGYKGVDYQKIVALLIESNKELIKQNQDLTSRLERLESKLD